MYSLKGWETGSIIPIQRFKSSCLLCIYSEADKDIYVFYVTGMFFTVRKGRFQHFGTDKA
jgi:hypothetical protein